MLRLSGLAAVGSIPLVVAGSIVLLVIGLIRWDILAELKNQTRKEILMAKQTILNVVLVASFCILDLIWAIGVGVTSGALSA